MRWLRPIVNANDSDYHTRTAIGCDDADQKKPRTKRGSFQTSTGQDGFLT